MFELNEKVVVVTGGAGILGKGICAALAAHGAKVAIVDRDGSKAASVAKDIAKPDDVRPFQADAGRRDDLDRLAREVEEAFGPVTTLVNNIAHKSKYFFQPFESFPLGDWNEVMHANTTAVMLSCQVFGGAMARRGNGSIITTLSIYGIVAPDQRIYEGSLYEGRPINTPAVYSASKAALLGLTKYLAAYWGHRGVRVNSITPGGVYSGQNETFVRQYGARVPMGRMGRADEMSGAVVYLASDAASYVNGHNLVIDGGLTAW